MHIISRILFYCLSGEKICVQLRRDVSKNYLKSQRVRKLSFSKKFGFLLMRLRYNLFASYYLMVSSEAVTTLGKHCDE